MNWLMDHLEGVIALIVGTIAGVTGSVRMYFTIRNDIASIKEDLTSNKDQLELHGQEIEEIKRNSAVAEEQRKSIISSTERTEQKLDLILEKMIKGENT